MDRVPRLAPEAVDHGGSRQRPRTLRRCTSLRQTLCGDLHVPRRGDANTLIDLQIAPEFPPAHLLHSDLEKLAEGVSCRYRPPMRGAHAQACARAEPLARACGPCSSIRWRVSWTTTSICSVRLASPYGSCKFRQSTTLLLPTSASAALDTA